MLSRGNELPALTKRQILDANTPLDDFFADYPTFAYDRTKPVMAEFKRMCLQLGWNVGRGSGRAAHRAFKDALTRQFNEIYGTDIHSFEPWKKLCQILQISPIPETITECRKV